jgi:hypothetical protein
VNAAVKLVKDSESPALPHSIEAEQAVLGGLLLDPAAWDNVADVIIPEDFYRPDHKLIFQTIAALAGNSKPIDIITVADELECRGELEQVGGLSYLGDSLARNTPTAANVRAYADIVVERAQKRRLISMSHEVIQAVTDGASAVEIAQGLGQVLDTFVESATSNPIDILAFTETDILGAIEPERFLLPSVPADAYTLIAGALSSFKSTLLMYLLIWKATGWDILDLDPQGTGVDIGKCVLLTYEDTDSRILAKLQRVIQQARLNILRIHGSRDAAEFIERASTNIRRISLAGKIGMGILRRSDNNIIPNEAFLEPFFARLRAFAPDGALIGLDPLRLAIVGSQNDDDGADVAVYTLNRMATEIPGSGLIVASHSTKNGAQESGSGYAAAAYATSGSALYSQHARSNFQMARLKDTEIRELFNPTEVSSGDADKQLVAKLTHGRLSHGMEQSDRYLLMRGGTLVPVRPTTDSGPADLIRTVAVPIFAAIERLRQAGMRASMVAMESDSGLLHALGSVRKIRMGIKLLTENNYIQSTGSTSNRDMTLTDAGRLLVPVESCRESRQERE